MKSASTANTTNALPGHSPEFLWSPTRNELITTKFMRNRLLFTTLAHEILPRLRKEKGRPLRILFWACSTGAEPYTLKFLLGADSQDEIVGIDFDAGAIEQARSATYHPDTWTMFFDGTKKLLTDAEVDEFFEPAKAKPTRTVAAKYRKKVRFLTGDLFSLTPAVPEKSFDLVVCNNLLLHLKDASADAAFDYLLRYVGEGGLLLTSGYNPKVRAAAAHRLNLLPLPDKITEISQNWAGVSGAWHFPQRPAWAWPDLLESDPDYAFQAGEIFQRDPKNPGEIQVEPTPVVSQQTSSPKNIIITGSTFWNPGDDFVREGVIRVLRETLPGETLNFLFYNFNPDELPHVGQLPHSNVISQGDLEKFRDHVHAIVVVGVSAGHELKPLYRWVLANNLAQKVFLISGHYESPYAAEHIVQEPEASIFRQARLLIGRTNKYPDFIRENNIPYHRVNCPALLSVPEVKAVPAGKKIERIGFSIQLPPSLGGIINQSCAEKSYQLTLDVLHSLAKNYAVEVVAHHKTEYFHFLKALEGTGIPVVFSSFYHDLFATYRRYDLVITTRLHTSLFANGHGIPGIIINDTDRHTHALEGFPHSIMVNTQENFSAALTRWLNADLAVIAREVSQFKSELVARYVSLLKPLISQSPVRNPGLPMTNLLTEKLLSALHAQENKDRVLKIVTGLEKDYYIEHHDLIRYRETGQWFDTATFLNWYAQYVKPERYFEIGVRRGRSMAQVLVQSPTTKAFGFDMWIPDYASDPAKGIVVANPGPEFVQSELKKVGVKNPPTLTKGDSHVTVPKFFADAANPQLFDLMLVDGDHTADGARADLDIAFQHLAPGGALIFDDITHPAHLDLLDVWNEFIQKFPDHLFIADKSGQGTAVAFRPPFNRLMSALKIEAGQLSISSSPEASMTKNQTVNNPSQATNLEGARRILFVRTDSIGDAVLASSMLEPLKKRYPSAEISVLCQAHVAELFVASPFVSSVICYERKQVETNPAARAEILAEIAALKPDVVLNSVRSRDKFSDDLTLAITDAHHIAIEGDLDNITPADRDAARARYEFVVPTASGRITELKRHEDFLRGVGVETKDLQPAIWTTPDDELLAEEFFKVQELKPDKTIALFPGAQHEVRVYRGYADALKSFSGYRFLVFGDESQIKLADEIELQLPGRTVNLCGRSSLRETVALMKRCALYVGAESAGAHIACAVGVPNVVLLGGGHFARFMPYSPLTSAVSLPLDCFGCNWRCSHKRAHCVKDISAEVLAGAIQQTLEKKSARPRIFLQSSESWRGSIGLPIWKRPETWLAGQEVELIELSGLEKNSPSIFNRGVALPLPPLAENHERVSCPTCGGNEASRVRQSADIVQCRACETVYLRTRMTRHAMRQLYQSYADEGSHMALPKSLVEAETSGLKRDYFLNEILTFVKPGGGFLDVGCGWGAFLLNARSKGFQPRGIELTKACVNYANAQLGISVSDTQLDEADLAPGSLRVVTMNHVFEHLPEPRAALKQIFAALEPGGMFCGIVPNFASVCSGVLGEKWYWLDPNYHYQHFTPATLRKILEDAGLIVEKIYTATGDYGVDQVRKVLAKLNPQAADEKIFSSELATHESAGRGEEIRFFARKPALPPEPKTVAVPAEESLLIPSLPPGPEPLVTAVVSTYASEKFIGACLENLSRQSIFDRMEVIVVDSGSPENERAVVAGFQQQFPNIRYLRTPRETLYAAWNRALKLARGKYFANVNTDDSLRDDALEILAASLDKHTDCAYSYADCAWTTKSNDTFPSTHIIKTVKYPDYAPIETLFYCMTGCLQFFRTETLRALGGYEASLKCAGDYEATLKVMAAKLNAVHVPEVLSLFYQNTSGLTQASNRAALEHDAVMDRYRASLDLANIFQVDTTSRSAKADALALLGARAANFTVPWETTACSHHDFAFACYEAALELDPENRAAGMNSVVLHHKLERLKPLETALVARWPKMREWIQLFCVGERGILPRLNHAVLGPTYRPAEHAQRPSVEQLAREPKALHPWITRIDGRHVYLSEDLFPRPIGLHYEPKELQAAGNRLAALLKELPPFYAHFGGAGDALLLLASFYDQRPNAVVFSHPNGVSAARALFDAFPKLSKIYFLPQHTEPFFHIVLRFAVYELKNCLGAGATPRYGYEEEWRAGLDITKKYGVKKSPRWAADFRHNENSKRIGVAPKGSLSGMVGSKRNIILPEQWPQVIAHIIERGFEPVILGTPNEAKEYPALPGCVDGRKESFPGQMRIIGGCVGLVGADSWAKSFSALAEIPTLVFEPIKGADLISWKDPSDWVFIEPWPSIQMVKSLEEFRAAFDARLAKIPGAQPQKKSKPVIAWEGSFLDYGSLSHINRELSVRLPQVTSVGSTALPERARNDFDMKRCAKKLSIVAPKNVSVTVRHQWPPNWSRPESGLLVVIQPWEYGHLPQAWVAQAADVDEFWVPSPLVRHMYVDSGVPAEKVRVIPNGVDTIKFHPQVKPLKLNTKKKFKFLFVGGTIHRKGPDVLLDAFIHAFTSADDVCLVIKDFGGDSCYQGQTAETVVKAIQQKPNAPEILYLKEEFSSDQMPSLYAACDCLVLPYRGEGFGMPVLEAMSCGLPVIVTAGGATDSFVNADCGWKIPARGLILNGRIGEIPLVKSGWLLEPSKPHLVAAMKVASANRDECRRRGLAGRGIVERRFDWNDIAAMVSHRLNELAERAAVTEQSAQADQQVSVAQVTLPDVAKIGRLDEARELLAERKFEAAWNAGVAAIAQRPFHPEAFLLLAETALAAGDCSSAKRCAEHARTLAPGFEPAKRFLKQKISSEARPVTFHPTSIIHPSSSPRLSVCLITKNEEKFLAQSLKSVRGLATQIIVVDTGSNDRTVEIAREFGAEIYSFAWSDDFAAARNAAIEHATGDWILILDADEELPVAQHAKLLADLQRADSLGYRLPLVNAGQEIEGRSFIPRLFRNAPGVFFHGRIHEQVFPSLLPLCKKFGMQTTLGSAEILHHGYTKEMVRDRNKVERNLHLLKQAIADNPTDANLIMNLGLELVRSEKLHEGIVKYREAFALMSRQPANEIVPELREALLSQFTSQLYKIRGHEEVTRVLNSPLAKNGGLTASLHLALGLSLFELKNYPEAAKQMRECIAKRLLPALTPVNVDIHTAAPWHCLALCQMREGNMVGAEQSFEQALKQTRRTNEARVDYAKLLAEQDRAVDALKHLHVAITDNAHFAPAWRLGGQIALGQADFLEFALDWTGEALKNLPDDALVKAQRAEALLLAGQTAEAAPLWQAVWERDRLPRSLAALTLCCLTQKNELPAIGSNAEQEQCNRAFIGWYQKLLAWRAVGAVEAVNTELGTLRRILPTASHTLETALAESAEK